MKIMTISGLSIDSMEEPKFLWIMVISLAQHIQRLKERVDLILKLQQLPACLVIPLRLLSECETQRTQSAITLMMS